MKTWAKLGIVLAVLAGLGAGAWAFKATYDAGHTAGKQQCEAAQAKANTKAQTRANKKAKADLKRAQTVGHAQEQDRAAIDEFFTALAKESLNEAADPVDSCVLPDARLRRWNAANAGRVDSADQGGAAGQPDPSAGEVAQGVDREGARLGDQPPGGDALIPPAGHPDVQPAEIPGDQT